MAASPWLVRGRKGGGGGHKGGRWGWQSGRRRCGKCTRGAFPLSVSKGHQTGNRVTGYVMSQFAGHYKGTRGPYSTKSRRHHNIVSPRGGHPYPARATGLKRHAHPAPHAPHSQILPCARHRSRLTLPAPHFDTLGPSPAAGLSAKKAGYLADAIIDALKVVPKPKL